MRYGSVRSAYIGVSKMSALSRTYYQNVAALLGRRPLLPFVFNVSHSPFSFNLSAGYTVLLYDITYVAAAAIAKRMETPPRFSATELSRSEPHRTARWKRGIRLSRDDMQIFFC